MRWRNNSTRQRCSNYCKFLRYFSTCVHVISYYVLAEMPPKARKPLTRLANIYGHPGDWGKGPFNNPILTKFPERKSGLTPSFPKGSQTNTERQNLEKLDDYQRFRFRG